MDNLIQKVKQLVESLPDDAIGQFPADVKIMIVKKFGGEEGKEPPSERVMKLIELIKALPPEDMEAFRSHCPMH